MNPPPPANGLDRLLDFPAPTLAALADSLQHGPLRHGITEGLLRPLLGSAATELATSLRSLTDSGCTLSALALFCRTLHAARQQAATTESSVNLALSGPPVSGSPVIDTPTVVRSLFSEARSEVLVASYVFHSAANLLAPLAARHDSDPGFRVRIVVDLSHQRQHPAEPLPIIEHRFLRSFLKDHWRGIRPPEIWHDPRFASPQPDGPSGVMHAKLVVIDRAAALVTSANFTAAAQERNIEAGLLIRQPRQVQRLLDYFDGLTTTGVLKAIHS